MNSKKVTGFRQWATSILIDYDKTAEITADFYATVQNKFHYTVHGQTVERKIPLTIADWEKGLKNKLYSCCRMCRRYCELIERYKHIAYVSFFIR